MKRRQFLAAAGLVLAAGLSSCGANNAAQQDAAQQFLTERNGGTPVAIGGGINMPIVGQIERIDGPKLTVKRPAEGTSATIELAENVKIYKNIDLALSDIKVGDTITAFGTRQESVFQADLLRLGDDSIVGGPVTIGQAGEGNPGGAGPVMINRPIGGGPGTPTDAGPADQISGSGPMPALHGTVEAIGADGITVKEPSGDRTTVQPAANATIQKPSEVARDTLAAGMLILASGSQNGEVYTATQVQILPAPQQPGVS